MSFNTEETIINPKKTMNKYSHHVFENDQGTWSFVDSKMEIYLNSARRNFIVGPGINSAELYPSMSSPTYGMTSHLSDGMGGDRLSTQYNLKTLKSRLLGLITWSTDQELQKTLKDNSMMPQWRQKTEQWRDLDLGYFKKYTVQ